MVLRDYFLTEEEIAKLEKREAERYSKLAKPEDKSDDSSKATESEKKVRKSLEPIPLSDEEKAKWFKYVSEPAHMDKYEPKGIWMAQIPEGYSLVNLVRGRLPKKLKKVKEPGLRVIWGLFKLFGSAVVVNQTYQTQHLSKEEVGIITTADGVELNLSLAYTYRIADPINSVVRNTNHLEALNNVVRARIRDTMGRGTLQQIVEDRTKFSSINLAPKINYFKVNPENYGLTIEEYILKGEALSWKVVGRFNGEEENDFNLRNMRDSEYLASLWRTGCELPELYAKSIDLSGEMEGRIAKQAEADFEAKARIRLAQSQIAIAESLSKAAEIYGDKTKAIDLLYMEKVAAEFAKNTGAKYIVGADVLKSITGFKEMFGKKE